MDTKRLTTLMATTAIAAMFTLPSTAQDLGELKAQIEALTKKVEALEKTTEKLPVVTKAEPAMALATSDGKYEMNLRGRIYADTAWISDSDNTMDVKATEFRTARLGIEGKAGKNVKYKLEADFAGNEVTLKDAYFQYQNKMGAFKVGQFKTATSLDEQTSSRHISVLERASFTDAFGLARQIGVGYSANRSNYTFNAGVYVGSAGTIAEGEGMTFAARGTYGNEFEGGNYLVGASVRVRDNGDAGNLRYRQRPHNHLSSHRFIETPKLSNKDTFYALEAAVSRGSLWGASEWAWNTAKIDGGDNYTFNGGYAEIGYFLTGEKRPLKLSKGAWDRPKVNSPLGEGGMGALALVARFDTIDLNDMDVMGGKQDTFIVGANWYLNRYSRIVINYSHSKVTDEFYKMRNGADGENSINALGVRFQVDW